MASFDPIRERESGTGPIFISQVDLRRSTRDLTLHWHFDSGPLFAGETAHRVNIGPAPLFALLSISDLSRFSRTVPLLLAGVSAGEVYKVRSIPATFLIGPDGSILVKNLRRRAQGGVAQGSGRPKALPHDGPDNAAALKRPGPTSSLKRLRIRRPARLGRRQRETNDSTATASGSGKVRSGGRVAPSKS